MDLFFTSKYQSKYENILFVSKCLYDLLKKPQGIDSLFKKFEEKTGEAISCEYEQTLLLSLCFLFSVDLIELHENKIRRTEK